MKLKNPALSRRQLIGGTAASLGAAGLPTAMSSAQGLEEKKFVFTICAAGGASIIDSFLAQASGPAAFTGLVQPAGSPFKAVPVLNNSIQGAIPLGNGYAQSTFLTKFASDMVVMTCEVSSVNHIIAAKRSITGDNVFGGRTLGEAIAAQFGKGLPLANMMLAGGGYATHGDDITVSDAARAQVVADPLMFAFATHGYKGLTGAPAAADMRAARELRAQLETVSRHYELFKDSKLMDAYRRNRDRITETLEKGDMITKLMMLDPASNNLASFGLETSADINLVREKFPNMANDPFEARMALGFLAAKNGVSNAISVAPSPSPLITAQGSPNSPLAFDWSHVDHRAAQNSMWSYILKSVDALIDLLKATDIDGRPELGKMWDRSLIYIATEFGRDKIATGGSGHHLNNGVVMISPMLQGNKVFGGVDPTTGMTFGFDPQTGAPNPAVKMKERDIYSAIAHAVGLNFENRGSFPSMVRKA